MIPDLASGAPMVPDPSSAPTLQTAVAEAAKTEDAAEEVVECSEEKIDETPGNDTSKPPVEPDSKIDNATESPEENGQEHDVDQNASGNLACEKGEQKEIQQQKIIEQPLTESEIREEKDAAAAWSVSFNFSTVFFFKQDLHQAYTSLL